MVTVTSWSELTTAEWRFFAFQEKLRHCIENSNLISCEKKDNIQRSTDHIEINVFWLCCDI